MTDETAGKPLAEIVDVAFEALSCGDMDTFRSFLADGAKLIEPDSLRYGGIHVGPAKIKAIIEEIRNVYWRDFSFDVEAKVSSPSHAMIFGKLSAIGAKPADPGRSISAKSGRPEAGP